MYYVLWSFMAASSIPWTALGEYDTQEECMFQATRLQEGVNNDNVQFFCLPTKRPLEDDDGRY